jgi:multicomponent Na+:H+ antiporter subunit E
LLFGGVSVVLVVFLAARMRAIDREALPLHLLWRAPRYWLWLVKEIVVANLTVIRLILHPRLSLSPRLIQIQPTQHSDLGRVIFANSITLTPGTVSVLVTSQSILVHALTAEGAATLQSGEMDRRVTCMEGPR